MKLMKGKGSQFTASQIQQATWVDARDRAGHLKGVGMEIDAAHDEYQETGSQEALDRYHALRNSEGY